MKLLLIRFATRYYRLGKIWILKNKPPLITGLFFGGVTLLDHHNGGRRLTKAEQMANGLWKQNYFAYWKEHSSERYLVRTANPVAINNDDHVYPRGAIMDNSKNYRFNLSFITCLTSAKTSRFSIWVVLAEVLFVPCSKMVTLR